MITSAGAAGRGGTEDLLAAASVGADLPRARPATRRRLSAFRVDRSFRGIEERNVPSPKHTAQRSGQEIA